VGFVVTLGAMGFFATDLLVTQRGFESEENMDGLHVVA
jgi:hypothetical protein